MTTHRDYEHARMHVSVDSNGRTVLDAYSNRRHLLSIEMSGQDLLDAIVGIEHKMDCEIIHLAGAATEQRDLLDKPQQIGYDGSNADNPRRGQSS